MKKHALTAALTLSLALAAFLPYRYLPGSFFTGADSLTLIETSRFSSLDEAADVITRPLMHGAKRFKAFGAGVLFHYRPVSSLSYGLDHARWGLEAAGYHQTDLALHISVCLLLFLAMRLLLPGDLRAAWLGGLLFALHPALVETVPAVSRRQDLLATSLMLCAFIFFLMSRARRERGASWLAGSVIAYALAFGAKETAIILPAVVGLHLFLFRDRRERGAATAIGGTLKGLAPFLGATAVLFGWRWLIAREYLAGGPAGKAAAAPALQVTEKVARYVLGLADPAVFFDPAWSRPQKAWLVLGAALAFLILLGATLGLRRGEAGEWEDIEWRTSAFLLLWAFAPLGIYLPLGRLCLYYLYLPTAPFCAFLGLALSSGWARVLGHPGIPGRGAPAHPGRARVLEAITALACTALAGGLLWYSPLFRNYAEWRETGEVARQVLRGLSDVARDLPPGSVIRVANLPVGIAYDDSRPRAREVTTMNQHSVRSWLALSFPEKGLRVAVERRVFLRTVPTRVAVEVIGRHGRITRVRVVPEFMATGPMGRRPR